MREQFQFRLRVIATGIVIVVLLLVARLYVLQIERGDELSSRADRQYVRPQEGLFERGTIFFEDKNGARIRGAIVQSGFSLALNPTRIEDPEETYSEVSTVIELDEEDFLTRARKEDDPYEVVAHRVSREDADSIDALDLSGVQLYKEQWRHYPSDTLASQTLGFVAFSGDELTGRYGLEREYNDVLKRETENTYINFFAEVFSNVGDIFAHNEGRDGDIVTTLEPTVQRALEKELHDVVDVWNAQASGGIILHPKTGAIYALGVTPTFDLNNFRGIEDPSLFNNPLVESVFEMGSIVKPLTMAAGLDVGAVTPETTYTDRGFLNLDNGVSRISNYDGKGRGEGVAMTQVLGQSLNTGVAFVVSRMGNDVFADYLEAYGLGEETGIDLPGEVSGLLGNLDSPRDVEYATASFGQGIALTPIATARALAALGNGGKLITPHVVREIEYDVGLADEISYDLEDAPQVLKPETSETITRMLVEVVDDYLVGGTVELEHHSIAAKTGTAQIADRVHGGYYDDRFFHSFFGYFPAYDPEFLIFLYVDQPQDVRYASETLTDPFMNLAKFIISYYEIPPDR